ncbi:Inorganic pyrophosphatase [Coemansia sp. Benny D115]|nr:Inorganic pyrophosphatase [Coemansia sp. Benny D115]
MFLTVTRYNLARMTRRSAMASSLPQRLKHTGFETSTQGGPAGSASHLMYFSRQGTPVSPWHDIPLEADGHFHMVCEVPRWTNAKMEIDTKAPFNPIRQDAKNGRLRFVANTFPYKGYIWNYGALPQTFEDPQVRDRDTGCVGDSDPLDVVEIGQAVGVQGAVYRVKVLGLVALIDDGETDWKILAIRSDDPLADKLQDVADIDRYMPGLVGATVDWFTRYKVPDGKGLNKWAFGGKPKDAAYARGVIADAHEAWRRLIRSSQSKFALKNVSVDASPHRLLPSDANNAFTALTDRSPGQVLGKDPQAAAAEAAGATAVQTAPDKWYYLSGSTIAN